MIRIKIHHGHYLSPALSTIIVFAFFVFFYLFITERLSFISRKPLVLFGTISYSLYLTHQSISTPIMQYLCAQKISLFLVFSIALFFSILLATAITFGIEKPAMAYIRDTYKKWRSQRDTKSSSHKWLNWKITQGDSAQKKTKEKAFERHE